MKYTVRRRVGGVVTAVAVTALVAAGCSSSDDDK